MHFPLNHGQLIENYSLTFNPSLGQQPTSMVYHSAAIMWLYLTMCSCSQQGRGSHWLSEWALCGIWVALEINIKLLCSGTAHSPRSSSGGLPRPSVHFKERASYEPVIKWTLCTFCFCLSCNLHKGLISKNGTILLKGRSRSNKWVFIAPPELLIAAGH